MSKGGKPVAYVVLAIVLALATFFGALAMKKQAENNVPLEVNFESHSSARRSDSVKSEVLSGDSADSGVSTSLSEEERLQTLEIAQDQTVSDAKKPKVDDQEMKDEPGDVLSTGNASLSASSDIVNSTEREWVKAWVKPLHSIVFVDYKGERFSENISDEETMEDIDTGAEETVDAGTDELSASDETTDQVSSTELETKEASSETLDVATADSSSEWRIEADGISYLTLDFVRSYLAKNIHSSHISVYLEDMRTGKVYMYGTEEEYYVASTIHPAIAITVYNLVEQGGMSLDDEVEYLEDKDYEDGEGLLISSIVDGESRTVSELLELMISHNDNIATNMLIRSVCSTAGYDWYKKQLSAVLGISYNGRMYSARTMGHMIRYFCKNYGENSGYERLKEYMENTSNRGSVTTALPAGSFFQKQGSFVMDSTLCVGSVGAIYGEYPVIFAVYIDDEVVLSDEVFEELGKYFYFVAQTGMFPEEHSILE